MLLDHGASLQSSAYVITPLEFALFVNDTEILAHLRQAALIQMPAAVSSPSPSALSY